VTFHDIQTGLKLLIFWQLSTKRCPVYKMVRIQNSFKCHKVVTANIIAVANQLWNQLPAPLRQPRTNLSNSASPSSFSGTSIDSPLSSTITPSLFHSRLKTSLFCKSFPPQPTFSSPGLNPRIPRTVYRYFWAYPFLLFSLPVLHCYSSWFTLILLM